MNFETLLKEEIIESGRNYYTDNYDYYSFPKDLPIKKRVINVGKKLFFRKPLFKMIFKSDFLFRDIFLDKMFGISKYLDGLEKLFQKLEDDKSKELLVKLITFRVLGYLKVKLPYHTDSFWDELKELESFRDEQDFIKLDFKPWKLYYHNLESANLKLYFSTKGCYCSILREHYKHEISQNSFIGAEEGDVVLDLGGCYGDTALYFAKHVGEKGKVYSFEFIPGSIDIFNRNIELNPELKSAITIVDNPLWNKSDLEIYYQDRGGGSKVSFEKFPNWEGTKKTITIDDFVSKEKLEKIDFIKTDIEGAEPFALEGAINTIKQFKPKLAISIYHSMDDFVNIIQQIDELDLGYKYYLGHASIYASETVLFCTPRNT